MHKSYGWEQFYNKTENLRVWHDAKSEIVRGMKDI